MWPGDGGWKLTKNALLIAFHGKSFFIVYFAVPLAFQFDALELARFA
jgi:hypothetical protein